MKNKMEKTNVMRILDQKKIPYEIRTYPHGDEAVDGIEVARLLEQDPKTVYKTLVAQGASRQYYVFDIPVDAELDLKKAAKAVGEKSVAMLHVKDLLPLTGYVRGGHEEAVFHHLSGAGRGAEPGCGLSWEDRLSGHSGSEGDRQTGAGPVRGCDQVNRREGNLLFTF